MRHVLFLYAGVIAIALSAACQQAPANKAEELVTKAESLRNEAQGHEVVDAEEYVGDFSDDTGMTAHAIAQYLRFQNGSVGETITLQMPARMPLNEPFIRAVWRDGAMEPAELCELVEGTQLPRCQPLAEAHRFPILRNHGENLLREIFQLVQPQLRRLFDNQTISSPPEEPPSRVTKT